MSGTTIELGIEEQFVSQLQRVQPVDDTPSDQAHDTTRSQEKGEATASQVAEDGTGMTETLQSQENDIQRTEEHGQSHIEDNSANNTNTISTQPLQQGFIVFILSGTWHLNIISQLAYQLSSTVQVLHNCTDM